MRTGLLVTRMQWQDMVGESAEYKGRKHYKKRKLVVVCTEATC